MRVTLDCLSRNGQPFKAPTVSVVYVPVPPCGSYPDGFSFVDVKIEHADGEFILRLPDSAAALRLAGLIVNEAASID